LQPSPPPALAAPQVLEPVVNVVLVGDPELESLGQDAVSAPERWPLRLLGNGGEPAEERLARLDRLALAEGSDLPLPLSLLPVSLVFLLRNRLDAPRPSSGLTQGATVATDSSVKIRRLL
jgi:hypothetical protein